jgi:hypothetical protein
VRHAQKTREPGFYWVRRCGGEPEVNRWDDTFWWDCEGRTCMPDPDDDHDPVVEVLSERLTPPVATAGPKREG